MYIGESAEIEGKQGISRGIGNSQFQKKNLSFLVELCWTIESGGSRKELVVAAISAFFILQNRRMMLLRDVNGNRIPGNVRRARHPTLHPYNIADAFSHDKQ